jgi:hypothetical protein
MNRKEGNEYSVDGSYDLAWNHDFPIEGDRLWPSGRLLQLQWLLTIADVASEAVEWMHLFILEKTRAIVADAGKDCPFSLSDFHLGNGYKFCTGTMTRAREFSTMDIAQVMLEISTGEQRLSVKVKEGLAEKAKTYSFYNFPPSRALYDLAKSSISAGIIAPTPKLSQTRAGEERLLVKQLMFREIQRQFKRAAPNAEIVLKGNHMPEGDFRRIVK